jgi:uncharacterized protein YjbI with pentapeptide repeats
VDGAATPHEEKLAMPVTTLTEELTGAGFRERRLLDFGGWDAEEGRGKARPGLLSLIARDLPLAAPRGADLMQSDMSGTKLFEANLFKADLSKANLFRAQGLTDEQLSVTRHS